MYLSWTVLLTLTMLVTQTAAAVATMPLSAPTEDRQSKKHVIPEETDPSTDPKKRYLTEFPEGTCFFETLFLNPSLVFFI